MHYVYRITNKKPFDDRLYYIGKHSGKVSDIGYTYFTSGKISKMFKDSPNDFDIKIIGKFDTPEEALTYEGKIHHKLNVEDNPLFYNEQNQTLSGKLDRTGRVTVIKIDTGERMTISCELFHNNKDIYRYLDINRVTAKSSNGEYFNVDKDEFQLNSDLKGVNADVVHVKDKEGRPITIPTSEYHKNKDKYTYNLQKLYAKDTEGNIVHVSYEEFQKRDDLVAANKGSKQKAIRCDVCDRDIGSSNIERHIKTHYNRFVYATDNNKYQTVKVSEYEFYTKLKDTHYIEKRNGHNTPAYSYGNLTTERKLRRENEKNRKNRIN